MVVVVEKGGKRAFRGKSVFPTVAERGEFGPSTQCSFSGGCIAKIGPARYRGGNVVGKGKMALKNGNTAEGLEAGQLLRANIGLSLRVGEPRSSQFAAEIVISPASSTFTYSNGEFSFAGFVPAGGNMDIPTLGRPFQLGMLYDCRSDILIPAVTLWDLETLQQNVRVWSKHETQFKIYTLDSIQEKTSALSVDGSLKASIFTESITLDGSAKYLTDTKRLRQQARVTLQYRTTTRFEQLTMSHLGRQNITHPTVFDEGTATHVVTAVLYGAQAFFVFDQEVSSGENLQDIQGHLEGMIKVIPRIASKGEISLKMTEEQQSKAQKFQCTFYGDFLLENNPTTFQDAFRIYTTLRKLLGVDGDHAVPMIVWLYPLYKLESKAAQLVRDISIGLVSHCQSVLEQLNETVMRCNDMMRDSPFPEIGSRITEFQNMCLEYKQVFQKTLSRVLPSIRGGGEEEESLANILEKEQSPFRSLSLIAWLECIEMEIAVVSSYLDILKGIKIVSSKNELNKEVLNPNHRSVVCFVFTLLQREDPYLSALSVYLKELSSSDMENPPQTQDLKEERREQWFNIASMYNAANERECDFERMQLGEIRNPFQSPNWKEGAEVGEEVYRKLGEWIPKRKKAAATLLLIADKLDEIKCKSSTARVVGSSVATVGGLSVVGSVVGTVMTRGLTTSLVVAAAAGTMAAVSG
ncbi:neoverrucotoxin subunit alpha-like [Rhincodon typus]|uniref:neoverrucotoxin subunit alpha-like n=1 Tax=Rhincodon typus TaxID=259920 RepID=UPI00202E8BE7|nr:neoverrucotoxin subunit alpha-like [Rhincodon typus]